MTNVTKAKIQRLDIINTSNKIKLLIGQKHANLFLKS